MKIQRQLIIWGIAVGIFLFGLVQGFSVAVRKPLWTDEIYSQTANVERMSLLAMWQGGIQEGNNAPLFYSIQKVVCQLTGFQGGDLWHKHDLASMIILRIAPVIFMSLALAFIFWFFARIYSVAMGAAGLLLSMTTYLVWAYWAEARPYAMIFTITMVQAVVLMNAFRFKEPKAWQPVVGVHMLLALTSPLSVIQVSASALMLWLAGYRKFLCLVLMVVVPVAIGFWYHFAYKDHLVFWFAPYGQPLSLIKAAIPESRLIFLILAPCILWAWASKSNERVEWGVWLFQGWVWLTMLGYGMFLFYLLLKQKPGIGFEISNRYMMALAPIGIVAVMFLSIEFLRRARSVWVKSLVWLTLVILILPRLVKVFRWAYMLN